MNALKNSLLTTTLGIGLATTPAYALTQSVQDHTTQITSQEQKDTKSSPKKKKTLILAYAGPKKDMQIVTLDPIEIKAEPIELRPFQEKIIEDFRSHLHDFSTEELARIATHHEWLVKYLSKIFPDAEYSWSPEIQRELMYHATLQEYAQQALDEQVKNEYQSRFILRYWEIKIPFFEWDFFIYKEDESLIRIPIWRTYIICFSLHFNTKMI